MPETTDPIESPTQPLHRRGRWTGSCPVCRCSCFAPNKVGAMECSACGFSLAPPRDGNEEATEPTGIHHPRWEDDARLQDTWDRYSRPGALADTWGSPGPLERCKGIHGAPSFWAAPGRRGQADDDLDATRKADAEHVEGLADALRSLMAIASQAKTARATTGKGKRSAGLLGLLLDHTAEATGERSGGDVDPQPWLLDALALLLANALLRRGVDVYEMMSLHGKKRGPTTPGSSGPLEPVAPRLPRSTPFAGWRQAFAVACSGNATIGGRAPVLGGATPEHAIPSGMVYNQIAVHPSRSGGSAKAPGVDTIHDQLDVRAALAGLPDLDLLTLTDLGSDPLDAAAAVAALRKQGRRDLTERTFKQAQKKARGNAVDELRLRGFIPPQRKRPIPQPAMPLDLPRFA